MDIVFCLLFVVRIYIPDCVLDALTNQLAIVVGSSLILALLMFGLRRLSPGIPLASTCSAAISAACHVPEEDKQPYLFPLCWGVVKEKDGVGHCCFTTARDVKAPIEGLLYK